MLQHLSNLYLGNRFFAGLAVVAVLSAVGFAEPLLYRVAIGLLLLLLGWLVYDVYLLYRMAGRVTVARSTPRVLSLGDEMRVRIAVANEGNLFVRAEIIDELPEQLQLRDHRIDLELAAGDRRDVHYTIRPLERGCTLSDSSTYSCVPAGNWYSGGYGRPPRRRFRCTRASSR